MARLGGGILLLIAGVISGFLPVLQGWMFILAGLALMAPESRRARELLDWAKEKAGVDTAASSGGDVASDPGSVDPGSVDVQRPGKKLDGPSGGDTAK